MGVDLGLEDLQLAAALLPFLADDVVHQVPHGGHHGGHGVTQPLDLIAAALLNFHIGQALVQLPDGALQPEDGVRDPGGDQEVQKGHQKDGKQQQRQAEQGQLGGGGKPAFRRGHAHQLPPGVAHGLDGDLPGPALEDLLAAAVPVVRRRPVVLLQEPGVNELLPGMVDQLPAAVDKVEIAPAAQRHVPAHLLDAAEAHVHQQHAPLGGPVPGQLDVAAQGDHPAVGVVGVVKDILDVRGGKVEVFHALAGRLEPVAVRRLRVPLQRRQGHGGHQGAISVKDRQGHQVVPVLLVEQGQVPGEVLLRQVCVLDAPVIHRIGNAHHPPEVAVQVQVRLGQHPAAVFRHQLLVDGGKAPDKADAH